MTAKTQPIESFGPEMFAALISGSRRRIELEFPSYRGAIHFVSRVHLLRKNMREAKHEQYPIAARVRVSVLFGPAAGYPKVPTKLNTQGSERPLDRTVPAKVILSPHDSEFSEVLKKAGVTVVEREPDALPEVPTENSLNSVLDAYAPIESTAPPSETKE